MISREPEASAAALASGSRLNGMFACVTSL